MYDREYNYRETRLHSVYGKVYCDGDILGSIDVLKATITFKYEIVYLSGGSQGEKLIGWSGTGYTNLKKLDRELIKSILNSFSTGVCPRIKILAKLIEPTDNGRDNIQLKEVTLHSLELGSSEFTFNFGQYEYVDSLY